MVKKSKNKSKKTILNSLSPQALEQSAASFYQLGDYKNALPRYERLYKANPTDVNKSCLIDCLLKRAGELCDEELYVEALFLLNNLRTIDAASLPIEDYLVCLMHNHDYEKALAFCHEQAINATNMLPVLAPVLSIYLGVKHHLSSNLGQPALYQPEVDLFHQLMTQLDNQPTNEQLLDAAKKISLRSPLRDLRLTLQALAIFADKPAQSWPLVRTILTTSACYPIVKVIDLARQSNVDLLQNLSNLSANQLTLLQWLKRWSSEQLATIIEASKLLTKHQSASKVIPFILKQQALLPEHVVKRFCLSLYDGSESVGKLIDIHIGNKQFAHARLRAIKGHLSIHADKYWESCIDAIKASDLPDELIGIIKLHQYETEKRQDETNTNIDWLIDSLTYLPNRKATYLSICEQYSKEKQDKLHYQWLDKTYQQFPTDVQVILNLAQLSLQKKSFTKTAQLLTTALAIDAINTQAKQLLAQTYVEKACDDTACKRLEPAQKALTQAKALQSYLKPPYLFTIAESIVAFYSGCVAERDEKLTHAYQQAGNKLIVNYLFWHHTANDRQSALLLKNPLNWAFDDDNAFNYLSDGLKGILNYLNTNQQEKYSAFDDHIHVHKLFELALKQPLTVAEYQLLCDLCLQLEFYTVLQLTAKMALKKHKKSPLFNYYHVQATIRGNPKNVTQKQLETLINDFHNLPSDPEHIDMKRMLGNLIDDAEKHLCPEYEMPFIPEFYNSLFD